MRAMWLALVAGACAVDGANIDPGILYLQGQDHIEYPSSVAVGESFLVKVNTYGTSCYSAAPTEIYMSEDVATVAVFDRRPHGNCTIDIVPIVHSVSLTFGSSGTKSIVVRGWDSSESPVEIPNALVVR